MKKFLFPSLFSIFFFIGCQPNDYASAQPSRPNIILIMGDDMEKDPTELEDLAATNQKKLKEMVSHYDSVKP